jgi:hypothetical protein
LFARAFLIYYPPSMGAHIANFSDFRVSTFIPDFAWCRF